MNYELAKELKDAGFPQAARQGMYQGVFRRFDGVDGSFAADAVYFPILEELIDACPKELPDGHTFSLIWTSVLDMGDK